jgi:hypothetical protein
LTQALRRADERLTNVLHLLNVPTHRDVRRLQEQLNALNHTLEELLAEQGQTPSDDAPASADVTDAGSAPSQGGVHPQDGVR